MCREVNKRVWVCVYVCVCVCVCVCVYYAGHPVGSCGEKLRERSAASSRYTIDWYGWRDNTGLDCWETVKHTHTRTRAQTRTHTQQMEYLSVLIKFIKFWECGKLGYSWCVSFSAAWGGRNTHTHTHYLKIIQSSFQGGFQCRSVGLCVESLYKTVQKCIAVQSDMYMHASVRVCVCVCVCVCPGTKESGGSSVAGREQINPQSQNAAPQP